METTHPNYPWPTMAQRQREAEADLRQADIAREMKPANDIMELFLSKRDEMTALCNVMRVSPAYVECVVEAVQEWHHELMKRAG